MLTNRIQLSFVDSADLDGRVERTKPGLSSFLFCVREDPLTIRLELEKREAQLLLMALGISIEQTNCAVENCYGFPATDDAIRERRCTLSDFQRLRNYVAMESDS